VGVNILNKINMTKFQTLQMYKICIKSCINSRSYVLHRNGH